jgi:hypothetical protein
LSAERNNPPRSRPVALISEAKAKGATKRAVVLSFAAVLVIIADAALGFFSGKNKSTPVAVGAVHFAAGVVAYWAAVTRQRALAIDRTASKRHLIAAVVAVATLLAPYLTLPIAALRAWITVLRLSARVPDPEDAARSKAEYDEAVSQWHDRIASFEAAERDRFETADLWFPVEQARASHLTCVFGGLAASWDILLTTHGASLLGSGASVLILDLSARTTTRSLVHAANAHGVGSEALSFPSDAARVGLLTGLDWKSLVNLLIEAIHTTKADDDQSREARTEDRAVLLEVVECLNTRTPVSLGRLRTALRVVTGEHAIGRRRKGDVELREDEYDQLADLYNDVEREHGGVMERVTRLGRLFGQLAFLDGPSGGLATTATSRRRRIPALRVVGIDKDAEELDSELLVDVLFQLFLRTARVGAAAGATLIVLGADRVRRVALERLSSYAEREGILAVLFFEHLRADALDVVGGGGAVAGFMALPNNREAKAATEFIGSSYKWVESQRTRSVSDSITETSGTEESRSSTGFVFTDTKGTSYSKALGKAVDYATATSRVREALVDPEELMGLAANAMLFVEVHPKGGRRIAHLDFNPVIAFAPRISDSPRQLVTAGEVQSLSAPGESSTPTSDRPWRPWTSAGSA